MAATNAATKPAPQRRPADSERRGRAGVIIGPKRVHHLRGRGHRKTTLAADAPRPIFFDIEGRPGAVDADRYPFHDGDDGHVPRDYDDVCARSKICGRRSTPLSTLVIDTADRLESLLWAWMIRRDSDPSVYRLG